ncbi:MAG: hypothetical protein Satyrvirus21_17 [Satyrvirus sp.]|uniref:Uncharacterized protein n=1 Tax=Satyrvirus sp. TaxID=2487771 RepID=A0A3G5AIB3_9VIRU|nr:MAG: hypothetical protein Satyrvirus21_17 [Satyrvirus sp.]
MFEMHQIKLSQIFPNIYTIFATITMNVLTNIVIYTSCSNPICDLGFTIMKFLCVLWLFMVCFYFYFWLNKTIDIKDNFLIACIIVIAISFIMSILSIIMWCFLLLFALSKLDWRIA